MAIVVANNMKKLSSKVDDIGINYYFPKFKNMDKYTSFVLDSAKESLEMYINKFGKYPYDEIDVVSCYYRSGMEFPGLILVGLPDIKNMNDRGKMFMEIIVDKNRSGTKGSNYYLYDGKTMKYVPIG